VYPFLLLGVVAFYCALGLPVAALLARRSLYFLSFSPIFGFALLSIAGSWYALLEVQMNRAALIVTVVAALLVGVWILRMDGSFGVAESGARTAKATVGAQIRGYLLAFMPVIIGILGLTFFVMPMITSELLESGFVTSFTSDNNDLASYILQATNVAQAGFGPTEILVDPDLIGFGSLGDVARYDHTGASALLASTSVMFGLPVWKVATVSVLAAASCLVPAVVVFVRQVSGLRLRWCLIAGTVATFTVYFWYMTSQGFYAQLLAACLVVAELALFTWAGRGGDRIVFVAASAVLIAAGWFISPEVQLLALVLLPLVALAGLLQHGDDHKPTYKSWFIKPYLALIGWMAAAVVASLVLAVPRIKGAIEVLTSVSGQTSAGWPLNLGGSGASLLGIEGRVPGGDPNAQLTLVTGADVLAWLLLFVLLALLVVVTVKRKDGRAAMALVILAAIVGLIGVGIVRWGPTGYQTWKLIITLSAPAIALICGVCFLVAKTTQIRQAVAAVMLLLVGVSLANGQAIWTKNLASNDVARSRMMSPELVGLLRSPFLQQQQGLNVHLSPYFETMVAPAVYDKAAALSAPHYFSEPSDNGRGFPFPCTVMASAAPRPPQLAGTKVVKRTANYIVLGTAQCR